MLRLGLALLAEMSRQILDRVRGGHVDGIAREAELGERRGQYVCGLLHDADELVGGVAVAGKLLVLEQQRLGHPERREVEQADALPAVVDVHVEDVYWARVSGYVLRVCRLCVVYIRWRVQSATGNLCSSTVLKKRSMSVSASVLSSLT